MLITRAQSELVPEASQSVAIALKGTLPQENYPEKMAKRLIPLLDRVLVEKLQPATKTAGGILLPETAVSKVCSF